jgi:hypothetical protein
LEYGIGKKEYSRQDAKTAKKKFLSFRPKGESFLGSLAFAQDDRPRPVTLAYFAPLREPCFLLILDEVMAIILRIKDIGEV